jgi:hypothetical protein
MNLRSLYSYHQIPNENLTPEQNAGDFFPKNRLCGIWNRACRLFSFHKKKPAVVLNPSSCKVFYDVDLLNQIKSYLPVSERKILSLLNKRIDECYNQTIHSIILRNWPLPSKDQWKSFSLFISNPISSNMILSFSILERQRIATIRLNSNLRHLKEKTLKANNLQKVIFSKLEKSLKDQEVIEILNVLKTGQSINSLDFTYFFRLTDVGFANLHQFKNLKHLNLTGCKKITDATLFQLQHLNHLRFLSLSRCDLITDIGLNCLSSLQQLEHLDLSGCCLITDASLKHLQNTSSLRHLNLRWCKQITDTGLENLENLFHVENLDLATCYQISDAGIAYLKNLQKLKNVDLTGCDRITDLSLSYLKNMTQLTTLNLRRCPQVSGIGFFDLELHPDLKIFI